ncbi:MAG: DUF1236 domain-containing protein [Caulobacteraceae bacterium]
MQSLRRRDLCRGEGPDGITGTAGASDVTTQNVPSVAYDQPIAVGRTIDGEVAWMDVPRYPKYRWAYLGGHRVVVDAETHKVIAVY